MSIVITRTANNCETIWPRRDLEKMSVGPKAFIPQYPANNLNTMRTRAKFRCESVTNHASVSQTVELRAVSPKQNELVSEEDQTFWQYTPSGSLSMSITNPALIDYFKPGSSYYLEISEAPEPAA